MMKRPHIPIRWVRKLMLRQSGMCAAPFCTYVLTLGPRRRTNFVIEHKTARALGDRRKVDRLKNLELRCPAHAREKTIGTGATTAGSDVGKIKKMRHLKKKRLHKVDKRPRRIDPDEFHVATPWPTRKPMWRNRKRPWPKRKMR